MLQSSRGCPRGLADQFTGWNDERKLPHIKNANGWSAIMAGKPEHIPDEKKRAEVTARASYGVPQQEIAIYLGTDAKTLRKHYREELDLSRVKANSRVRRFLFEAASGDALEKGATYADCLRGSMFWAKTQMGFKDGETAADKADIDRVIEIVRAVRPDSETGTN
jgi:hypothetical protein